MSASQVRMLTASRATFIYLFLGERQKKKKQFSAIVSHAQPLLPPSISTSKIIKQDICATHSNTGWWDAAQYKQGHSLLNAEAEFSYTDQSGCGLKQKSGHTD